MKRAILTAITKAVFLTLPLQLVSHAEVTTARLFPNPFTSPAGMTKATYKNAAGQRDYLLYSPSKTPSKAGLLIVLHGCFQTGQQMADGTGFNALAEEHGLFVAYPEQTYTDNPWKCWNWFSPDNLQRDTGEISILAGIAQEIMEQKKISASRVFVTGLSAGGAMAANLLACYSDLFSGAAVHSGLEFMAATSEDEAHEVVKTGSTREIKETGEIAYKCSGSSSKLLKVMAIHGTKDTFVNTINSDRVVDQVIQINDFADDGRDNDSFQTTIQTSQIPNDPTKYPARVETFSYKRQAYLKKIWVEGMGHGWSGGSPVAPYMDSRGVNVSKEIVEFFY